MLSYLCARGMVDGPLFQFKDEKLLIKQRFVTAVRDGLAKAGIDSSKYSGHSFRIGAATILKGRRGRIRSIWPRFSYVRRPGDGKLTGFESCCCPRVLSRRQRFYSKRLLLGVFASETARQLTSSSG